MDPRDPRYQWPLQAYNNGQYAPPPPPNGYAPNGYPTQYPQQPMSMPQQYPPPQQLQAPQYMVNQSPQQYQQYASPQGGMGGPPRYAQPQVVIPPPRNMGMSSSPLGGFNPNPRIRQVQVQVPVQRPPPQLQRSSSGSSSTVQDGVRVQVPARPPQQPQAQTPVSKPVQRTQSFQENMPRPQQQHQQQTPTTSSSHQTHRAPLQPQSTPQQRMPSSQSSVQHNQSPRLPSTPSSQIRHPQVVIKKTTPGSVQSQTRPQYAPAKALPTDLAVMLLQLADNYIDAARGMGSATALWQRQEDIDHYSKLMSTGLGMMDAALKKFNHSPRDQAKLMLRYASLLIEETDNHVDIEEVLSKGVCFYYRLYIIMLTLDSLPCVREVAF